MKEATSAASDPISPATLSEDPQPQVRAAETRLLYENANTGAAVTIVISTLLVYAHWDMVSHAILVAWLFYMFVVSVGRSALGRWYCRTSLTRITNESWNTAFVIGTALAAAGWAGECLPFMLRARP